MLQDDSTVHALNSSIEQAGIFSNLGGKDGFGILNRKGSPEIGAKVKSKQFGLQDLSGAINATSDTMNQPKDEQPSSARSLAEGRPWGDPINLFRNNEGKKRSPPPQTLQVDKRNRAAPITMMAADTNQPPRSREEILTPGIEHLDSPKKKGRPNKPQTDAKPQMRRLLGRGSVDDMKSSKEALQVVDAKRTAKQTVRWIDRIKAVLDSNWVTYVYSFIIMLSIFGDDARRLLLMKEYDALMDYILIFIMLLFLTEIAYTMYSRFKEYVCRGAEFVLDLLATSSILFDIAMFSETYIAPLNK